MAKVTSLGKYIPANIEKKWPHSAKASRGKHELEKYIPSRIEEKWQKRWGEEGVYRFRLQKEKENYYNLVELPYPSGDLHLGHWFTFVNADAHARYMKMSGKNVFYPNGFDAFGLPAENAAIKRNIHPRDWTMKNIETMKGQFATMGTMIDWSHEAITCLPEYYRWNQWIFIKLFEKGLAYRGKAMSNWCPSCQTVLANEGIEDGKCWRCGSIVEQKEIEQWFLKITALADELLWDNVDERKKANGVDWPKSVREGQNNWIGRSEGAEIKFEVRSSKFEITVFTTRPDTLYGATFLVVAPEHPIVASLLKSKISIRQAQDKKDQKSNTEEVKQYIEAAKKKTEMERKEQKEKTGVFSGLYAIHPLTKEEIPVWVADYVLWGYGTGAIMAVPAHDERDHEFAVKYKLPIKKVIDPHNEFKSLVMRKSLDDKAFIEEIHKSGMWVTPYEDWGLIVSGKNDQQDNYLRIIQRFIQKGWYADADGSLKAVIFKDKVFTLPQQDAEAREYGRRAGIEESKLDWQAETNYAYCFDGSGELVNSGEWNGFRVPYTDMTKVIDWLEEKKLGRRRVEYHLHDWSISRQRYWGTPVPIIYCVDCWNLKSQKSNLKAEYGRDYAVIDGKEHAIVPVPLEQLPVELPYEVDYAPKGKPPLATAEKWLNVKCPKCGGDAKRDAETLDTFFDSSWYYYRYVSPRDDKAPFDPELVEGLMPVDIYFGGAEHTLGHTLYARFFTKFFKEEGLIEFDEFAKKRVQHGIILGPDGFRMSKSRGNVVNPDDVVKEYGADTVRLYLAFMMPFEATAPWSPTAMSGIYRFLRRVWELFEKCQMSNNKYPMSNEDLFWMHKTIKKVGEDLRDIKFNTAVSTLMEWLNHLSRKEQVSLEEYKTLLLLLSPLAPHMTEELWQTLNGKWEMVDGKSFSSIHSQDWPEYEEKYLVQDEVTIVVQVNGKVRDTIQIKNQKAKIKDDVIQEAKESQKVRTYLEGKTVKNVIYIEGKLLNFVTN